MKTMQTAFRQTKQDEMDIPNPSFVSSRPRSPYLLRPPVPVSLSPYDVHPSAPSTRVISKGLPHRTLSSAPTYAAHPLQSLNAVLSIWRYADKRRGDSSKQLPIGGVRGDCRTYIPILRRVSGGRREGLQVSCPGARLLEFHPSRPSKSATPRESCSLGGSGSCR